MGYGSSSKGGGGSGSAGGGKKKSGGKQSKPRTFKVKTAAAAAAAAVPPPRPPRPAFTVIKPDPTKRRKLMAVRKQNEHLGMRKNSGKAPASRGNSATTYNNNSNSNNNDNDDIKRTDTMKLKSPFTTSSSSTCDSSTDREKRLQYLVNQQAKADAVRNEQRNIDRIRRDGPYTEQIQLTQQNLVLLVNRLIVTDNKTGKEEFEKVRHVLGLVLKNAATKVDPKYKILKAYSNDKLWSRLLQHPEIITILVKAVGFHKEIDIKGKRTRVMAVAVKRKQEEEEVARIKERTRIHRLITEALDQPQSVVASLIADLEALEIDDCTNTAVICGYDTIDDSSNKEEEVQVRDFELCLHPTKTKIDQIFAILRVVNNGDK